MTRLSGQSLGTRGTDTAVVPAEAGTQFGVVFGFGGQDVNTQSEMVFENPCIAIAARSWR